jgi:hypothetical protein
VTETTADKPRSSRLAATVIAGLVAGLGLLASLAGTAARSSHEAPGPTVTSSSTMSAPAPTLPAAPGPWATTAQLAELQAEVRGYRGEVAGALRQFEQTTKRLRDVELEQAEQRGEQRAAARRR